MGYEYERVLGGLVRKAGEIAGEIVKARLALKRLTNALEAVDATILLFDPAREVKLIKPKGLAQKHAAFRGEMSRFVLEKLRAASEPVTSLEITKAIMEARELSFDDRAMTTTLQKRVSSCLSHLKEQEIVREIPLEGQYKGWALAPPPEGVATDLTE